MKKLFIIAIMSVVLAGISFYLAPDYNKKSVLGTKVYPNLAKNIDKVKSIQIFSKHGQTNIVKADNGDFVVKELSDFRAKDDRVKEIILGAMNLEYFEKKTNNPDNFKELEVEDIKEDAKAVRLVIKGDDDKSLFDLILGATKKGISGFSSGIFIRKYGDNQVWLARRSFDATGRALTFINHEFPKIKTDDIKSVKINQDGKTVEIKDKEKFANLFNFFADTKFFSVVNDDEKASFVNYSYTLKGGVTINVAKVEAESGNPLIRIGVLKGKAVSNESMEIYREFKKLEGWLYKITAVNLGYLLEIKK